MKRYGSRREVMNGTARMTRGRLTKKNFIKNKNGRIVSKKKFFHAKKKKTNPLLKLGYQKPKGSKNFGPNEINDNKKNEINEINEKNKSSFINSIVRLFN